MDNLMNAIAGQFNDQIISQLGQKVGLDQNTSKSLVQGALPFLMSAMAGNTQKEHGSNALYNAVKKDHDGSIFNNNPIEQAESQPGAKILSHIFGAKQGQVSNFLGQQNNVDQGTANKLMEMAAPLLMGALGKVQKSENLSASAFSQMVQSVPQQIEKADQQGSSLITKLLDADGDGSIMDDVAKMGMAFLAGKFFGKK